MKIKLFSLFVVLAFMASCVKKGAEVDFHYYEDGDYEIISKYLDLEDYPADFTLHFPSYYTRTGGAPRQFDNGMATLGRVLFYDKNLSSDRTISCASCHRQEIGFSDDIAFSQGVNNRSTARNSLALGSTFNFNEYYGNPTFGGVPFFWDNRAFTVSEQAKQTFGNPDEMGMHMSDVVKRVNELEYYEPFFKKEFFNRVDETNVLRAISEFVNSIGSFDSKFDHALANHYDRFNNITNIEGASFKDYTDSENRGKDLYLQNCASCHSNSFGAPSVIAANNGLYENYTDQGDAGEFKVPTLRNITLTGPYMHDGSIATLEEVIEHYSSGIKNNSKLNHRLMDNSNNPLRMNFSQQDKDDFIAFFRTLEDEGLMKEERFSDPFIQ